ncbi:GNAT family N-acetyltransferase [Kribbella sp. NPDC050281]|uniref:GNAT family N-acetyltransferase n=1 Tax=Kribbella sp. NPDC050281 TaxID=3155515 RepID=UPI0033D25335
MGSPQVRQATVADVEPAVRTLARAFEDYPMTRMGLDPDDYDARLTQYQRLFLTEIGLAHGRVWVTDDVSAVAIWTTPSTPADVFASHADAFEALAGSRAALVAEYEEAMGTFRPREPVWFLGVVGVEPDLQHQGLGRAVIAPGLSAADQDHSPAFLETHEPGNLPFYESLGFVTVAELQLPHDGPIHYALYRPPAPAV